MGIKCRKDFTLERSKKEREIKKVEERKQQQRGESRWEAIKGKHKGEDDRRNKQTGG